MRGVFTYLALFCVSAGLILVCSAYGGWGFLLNADTLSTPMMVADFLRDPTSFADWYQPPSLYLFPDWLFALPVGLLQAILLPPGLVSPAYSALLIFGLIMTGGWLVAGVRGLPLSLGAGIFAVVLIGTLLLMLWLSWWPGLGGTAGSGLAPARLAEAFAASLHGSATVAGVMTLALASRDWLGRLGTLGRLLALIWVLLSALSDFSYAVHFVLPLVLVLLLRRLSGEGKRQVLAAGCLLAAMLAGVGIALAVNGRVIGIYFAQPEPMTDTAAGYRQLIVDFWTHGGRGLLLAWLLGLLLMLRGAWLVLCLLRRRPLAVAQWLELAFAGSVAAAFAAPLLSSRPLEWRYLLPVLAIPLLWLSLLLAAWRRRRLMLAAAAPLVLASSLILVPPGELARVFGLYAQPPTLEPCLRAAGQRVGLASYWVAKPERFLSEDRLAIAPIVSDGSLHRWIVPERWFAAPAADPPTFLVPHELEVERLTQRFGRPDRELDCGEPVWIYEAGLSLQGAPPRLSEAGVTMMAAELPSLTGKAEGTARVADQGQDKAGFLSYGPYLSLPAGRYEVRLRYLSEGTGHRWDVVKGGARERLAGGPLPATSDAVDTISVVLDLPEGAADLEVRTVFSGTGRMELYDLEIRPR